MRSRLARAVLGVAVLATVAPMAAFGADEHEDSAAVSTSDDGPPPGAEPAPSAPPKPKEKEKTIRHRLWIVPRFVGAGFTYGKVTGSAPGIGTQEGRGWNIYFAWDLVEWLALGFRGGAVQTRVTWTPSPSETDSGAESGFAGIGLLARLRPGRMVDPWIGADLAYHSVNWDSYLYSVGGWGWVGSAGVDLRFVRWGVIRLGASYSSFTATVHSGYGQTGPTPGPEDDGQTAPMDALWLTAAWIFDFGPAHF